MVNALTNDKFELTELANKLFMYCDARQWAKMLDEVFVPVIWFDAYSMGAGQPQNIEAKLVCKMWDDGFAGLDPVHHQAGHYLISVQNSSTDIFSYAVAVHYKNSATKGHTRTFLGSYDLKAQQTPRTWRLTQFKYNLKFHGGNISME